MTNHAFAFGLGPALLLTALFAPAASQRADKLAPAADKPTIEKPTPDKPAIVVTGCLKAADDKGQPTDRSPQARYFVLSGVQTEAPATAKPQPLYRIIGLGANELKANVNAQVEVTGAVEQAATPGPEKQNPGAAPGTTGSASTSGSTGTADTLTGRTAAREGETAIDALPALRAKSIRKTADRCETR